MPRVSKQQSDDNRAAITAASARLFRERGIDGVSVADLMAAAGLTHGGFYGHFASKDALAAEACGSAFAHSVERWRKRVADANGAEAARTALVEGYLSAKSRGSPGTSCPAATMAGDVAREPSLAPVRAAYLEGIEHLVAILASVQPADNSPTDRGNLPTHRGNSPTDRGNRPTQRGNSPTDRGNRPTQRGKQATPREGALADLASMVGALLLSRATAEHSVSDEFLAAARKRLLSVSAWVSAQDSAPGSAHAPRRGGPGRTPPLSVSARVSAQDSAPGSAPAPRRGGPRRKPRRPAA